jgi:hypothetical protein
MDLDGDTVADPEFVDRRTQPHDRAHIFMAGCEARLKGIPPSTIAGRPCLMYSLMRSCFIKESSSR